MQNSIEVEIMLKGRDRTLLLPRVALVNVEPAFERLTWFRETKQLDQTIADQAAAALTALAKAAQ